MSSVPCISALSVEQRAQFGLVDLDNPVVRIVVTTREGGQRLAVDIASNVPMQRVGQWVNRVPLELRKAVEGRELVLTVDGNSAEVSEQGRVAQQLDAQAFAEHLFGLMREERGARLQALKRLPSLEDLRARLEGQMHDNLELALERGQRDMLPAAAWMPWQICREHHAELSRRQLAELALAYNDCHPLGALKKSLSDGPVYAVVTLVDVPCRGLNRIEANVRDYVELAATVMLPGVVRAAYTQMGLAYAVSGEG